MAQNRRFFEDGSLNWVGASSFNFITDLPWSHLWNPLGPAFRGAYGTSPAPSTLSMPSPGWPDEIDANAAPLTGGSGNYTAGDATTNYRHYVDSGASGPRHTAAVAAAAQVALPYTVVIVWYQSAASGYVVDGANEGGSGQRVLLRNSSGPVWSLYMGADQTGGTPGASLYVARIYATSGNDVLTINGSTILTGVDSSGGSWQGMSWTETGVLLSGGKFLHYSVMPGDLTTHRRWPQFQGFIQGTYGKPIS